MAFAGYGTTSRGGIDAEHALLVHITKCYAENAFAFSENPIVASRQPIT